MANHCVDCEVCGTDLRGSGPDHCGHNPCPGWAGGDFKDLDWIAKEHPDPNIRAKAAKVREHEEASRIRRREQAAEQKRREEECPGHVFEDRGGFIIALLECKHCGKQEYGEY